MKALVPYKSLVIDTWVVASVIICIQEAQRRDIVDISHFTLLGTCEAEKRLLPFNKSLSSMVD